MQVPGSLPTRSLRPLGVGELFAAAWQLYRQYFVPLVAIVAVVQVIVAVLLALIGISTAATAANPTGGHVFILAVIGLLTFIFTILATFVQSGALTLAIGDDYIGQPITVERAYSATIARLGALIGTSLLVALLLLLMSITVIGIPFAIWLGIRWAFIAQVVMLENLSGTSAMSRSSQLVAGSWWRTFGILILLVIVVAIVSSITSAVIVGIFHNGPVAGLARLIIQILLAPFYSAVVTLLYFDLRVRKEQFTHAMLASDLGGRSPSFGDLRETPSV
ncbi:MAG TPA: hypothetical protein VIU62_08950 [Chloroflexota bacterium]